MSQGSSVSIVTRLLNFWQGHNIFLFATASRLALGHTQPPFREVPCALSLGGGYSSWSMKLMTHFHLVLRLMCGAVPPPAPISSRHGA